MERGIVVRNSVIIINHWPVAPGMVYRSSPRVPASVISRITPGNTKGKTDISRIPNIKTASHIKRIIPVICIVGIPVCIGKHRIIKIIYDGRRMIKVPDPECIGYNRSMKGNCGPNMNITFLISGSR